MAKNKDIIKYRKPFKFNIGVVIFIIIIIYVLFNVFSYFTKKEIAEYQVQQGSIAVNHIYQGIIVRDETVEYTTEKGYVDYYVKNGSKVSVTDVVYSIDTIGNISNELAVHHKSQDISSETIAAIDKEIDNFLSNYDSNKFGTSYSFFNTLNSEIIYAVNLNAIEDLSDKISQAEANNTFHRTTSPQEGIVLFEVDNYESTTVEDLINNGWDFSSYQKTYLTSNRQVTPSDPVYKRINSENWTILLPIDETLAKEMNEKKTVTIRFCKDDFKVNAGCSVTRKNDNYYLKLSLKTGVVRYADERFVDIELVLKATTGLKIPVSAITSKEFFTIPKEYFTEQKDGLLLVTQDKKTGTENVTLIFPTIYYATEDYYYIDSEVISAGDVIQKPESQAVYVVGTHTGSLQGVYNINKGYAVFKQINILYQNQEYAIVETKTSYGIAQYDHIALDASSIKEHELISK